MKERGRVTEWEGKRKGGRATGSEGGRSMTDLSSSWYNTVLKGSGSDLISMDTLTATISNMGGVCSRSSAHCAARGSTESSSTGMMTLGCRETRTSIRVFASSTDAAMSLLLCCPKASGWSACGMARMT